MKTIRRKYNLIIKRKDSLIECENEIDFEHDSVYHALQEAERHLKEYFRWSPDDVEFTTKWVVQGVLYDFPVLNIEFDVTGGDYQARYRGILKCLDQIIPPDSEGSLRQQNISIVGAMNA